MEIVGTIVIGLLVGIVAKLLMPKKDPDGSYHHTARYSGVVFRGVPWTGNDCSTLVSPPGS